MKIFKKIYHFWIGAASAFDLSGKFFQSPDLEKYGKLGTFRDDRAAIAGDMRRVMKDIDKAIEEYKSQKR